MKAVPLSAQVEIERGTWDVLPQHLRTGGIVDELVWAKAPPHDVEAPKWT